MAENAIEGVRPRPATRDARRPGKPPEPRADAELTGLLLAFSLPLAVLFVLCTVVVNVEMGPDVDSATSAVARLFWHVAVSLPAAVVVLAYARELVRIRRARPDA